MSDFKVGEVVVHCREGVSKIIAEKDISGTIYFVIEPEQSGGDTIFVPKDNSVPLLRRIIDKKEAITIIKEMKEIGIESFNNTKQRRDNFHKRLSSGNPRDLAFLTKQLQLFIENNRNGVVMKLGPSDVNVLESARRMLYREFEIAFNVAPEKVEGLVIKYSK
ncbi:MAG: hypothetical protein MJ227_01225 [Bacilli bacterium]|nr:hypothetical protein [Bacilli bacterium]